MQIRGYVSLLLFVCGTLFRGIVSSILSSPPNLGSFWKSEKNVIENVPNKLRVFEVPIQLKLTRYEYSNTLAAPSKNSTTRTLKPSRFPSRTKAIYFQKILNLVPGKEFVFDVDRLRTLQKNPNFRDLKFKVKRVEGTDFVYVEVTGKELPSLKFSPELSFEASVTKPQLNGGFSFSDANFGGLTNKFHLLVSKKEGREKGTGDLPLTYSIKWTDLCNQYGADTASLSISFEEDHSFQDLDDLVLSSAVPTLSSGRRAQLGIKKASLLFRGTIQIPKILIWERIRLGSKALKENRMSSLASPSSSLLPSTPLAYTIEPYSSILSISPQQDSGFFLVNNLKRIKVNGVRLYARMLQRGFKLNGWYDAGSSKREKELEPYRQVGLEVTSPLFSFPQKKGNTNRFAIKSMRSTGKGKIPHLHSSDIVSSTLLRGPLSTLTPETSPRLFPRYNIFKWDSYFPNLSPTILPGFFVDTLLDFSPPHTESSRRFVAANNAIGFSISLRGLRLDIGWAVDFSGKVTLPRFHLGPAHM